MASGAPLNGSTPGKCSPPSDYVASGALRFPASDSVASSVSLVLTPAKCKLFIYLAYVTPQFQHFVSLRTY